MLFRSLQIPQTRRVRYGKREVVSARKQVAYKLPGTKSGLSGPKRVLRPLIKQACTHSNRQHHSCCLHQQGRRRHEVWPTLCPTTANPDLVGPGIRGLAHSLPYYYGES